MNVMDSHYIFEVFVEFEVETNGQFDLVLGHDIEGEKGRCLCVCGVCGVILFLATSALVCTSRGKDDGHYCSNIYSLPNIMVQDIFEFCRCYISLLIR